MSAKVTTMPSAGKYKWSQTNESITIQLPVKNVLLKHCEVVYSDLCMKANVRSINYVQVIDFPHEIDFDSPLNKVQLTDTTLDVFLLKKVPEHWDELQYTGLKGPMLTQRRNESLQRLYDHQKTKHEQTQKRVYELDSHVVKNQMKVEAHQREHIQNEKDRQKREFEDELDRDLQSIEGKHQKISQTKYYGQVERGEEDPDDGFRYNQSKSSNIWDDDASYQKSK